MEHKFNKTEIKLVKRLIKIEEEREQIRKILLDIVREKEYIYDKSCSVIYYPKSSIRKMDYDKLLEKYPLIYDECVGSQIRSEYFRIINNNK